MWKCNAGQLVKKKKKRKGKLKGLKQEHLPKCSCQILTKCVVIHAKILNLSMIKGNYLEKQMDKRKRKRD